MPMYSNDQILYSTFGDYDDERCPQAEADIICDITGMTDLRHLMFLHDIAKPWVKRLGPQQLPVNPSLRF